MKRRMWVPWFFGAILITGAACDSKNTEKKKAKAVPSTEGIRTIEIEPFDAIDIPSKVTIHVNRGASRRAQLKGPQNFLDATTLRVEKRKVGDREMAVLVAELAVRAEQPLAVIEVKAERLHSVRAASASRVHLDDFTSSQLEIVVERAARVHLKSSSFAAMKITGSEAARVEAPEVMVEEAEIELSGMAQVVLGQVGRLRQKKSGAAKLRVEGSPEILK